MPSAGTAEVSGPLFVVAVGLLGTLLGIAAEVLIARSLPRLGSLPATRARIATATITAFLCAAFALRLGADPVLPAFMLFAVLGVQLARIDISLHLLPNPLVLFLLLGGFILFLPPVFSGSQWPGIFRAVTCAAILFTIYLVLAIISPAGLGMGDVKLAAPLGLYLGYLGWSQLLYGGLLGLILNGIVTVFTVARNGKKHTSDVAHGPSMIGATVGIALLAF